jgi:hypothetical protein
MGYSNFNRIIIVNQSYVCSYPRKNRQILKSDLHSRKPEIKINKVLFYEITLQPFSIYASGKTVKSGVSFP